jgi:hypothetical protein
MVTVIEEDIVDVAGLKTQAIIDRYYVHFNRCRMIEDRYGQLKAQEFHQRHKGNPASEEAKKDFELLISVN